MPIEPKTEQEKQEIDAPIPFGKFEILGEIGSGGMAEVFIARQRAPGRFRRLVVIKRILPHLAENPRFVQLFLEEARIAALLDHPNVLPIYDLGRVDDAYFIAMPFVDGVTAGKILVHTSAAPKPLGLAECCELASQALRGLHYAHQRRDAEGEALQLVHRDVSPANLMVNREGRVLLLDFGVATLRDSPMGENRHRRGKLAYMSPEQARSESLDHRSDIFSLGTILYELIGATRLFKREENAATLTAICEEELPSLRERRPDLPPELEAIVLRALARDVDQRFTSAGEMADALDDVRRGLGMPAGAQQLARVVKKMHPALPAHLRARDLEPSAASEPTVDIPAEEVEASSRRPKLLLFGVALLLLAAGLLASWMITRPASLEGDPLRLAIAPHLPEAVIRREAAPLVAYLEKKLQRPVKLHVTKSYTSLVDRLVRGEIDVADLSGYPFLLARQRSPGVAPLASVISERSSSYEAYLLVRRDSKARRLADLRGKPICFVDRKSTSGYLVPRLMAREAGLDPDRLFSGWHHSGNHHQAMRDLLASRCEVAAVSSEAYLTAANSGIPSTALRVLGISRSLPYGLFCAGAHVPEALRKALRRTLRGLDLQRELGRARLGEGLRITSFGPVDLHLFDALQKEFVASGRPAGGGG